METEQCPKRGPGLTHVFDDGLTCDTCGVLRKTPTFSQWWAEQIAGIIRRSTGVQPTVLVVAGEPAPPERNPDGPDFSHLTGREWLAINVERGFWEKRGLDR